MIPQQILSAFDIDLTKCSTHLFGDGLINQSWKINCGDDVFLLQKINHQIFSAPLDIMENLEFLAAYFKSIHPGYLFVAPLHSISGYNFVKHEKDYYRLFPFVKNSYSFNTVDRPELAFEAARQFGKFTRLLSAFDPASLHITLPDFHNLTLRYQRFTHAVETGNENRILQSAKSIEFLLGQKEITGRYMEMKNNPDCRIRVIHHDTKINNVLFDRESRKTLCVIDLDTVMPGYFISDVGDMFRTYLSPVSEEELDFSKIMIREDYFYEIATGYMSEMNTELSEYEKSCFVYAGKFAIYMQALRFLTDFLLNDRYYKTDYENQNLSRAENQINLLEKYIQQESHLHDIFKTL